MNKANLLQETIAELTEHGLMESDVHYVVGVQA